jgi:hypothetical protein
MRKLMVFAVAASVSGCQTWGPTWSELSGQRYAMTSSAIEVGPTVINQIDGLTPNSGPLAPAKITPGLHKVVLQAVPPGGVSGLIHLEEITFDAKPCVRYYINARFKTSTSTDWAPFIDYQESIPGCQVSTAGATK